jgi:hypothetical protein
VTNEELDRLCDTVRESLEKAVVKLRLGSLDRTALDALIAIAIEHIEDRGGMCSYQDHVRPCGTELVDDRCELCDETFEAHVEVTVLVSPAEAKRLAKMRQAGER